MPDPISKLDAIIERLESALEGPATIRLHIAEDEPPRSATYRVLEAAFGGLTRRKKHSAEVHRSEGGTLIMHSPSDVPRNSVIEISMFHEKNRDGETVFVVTGSVRRTRRISGTYEIQVEMKDVEETLVTSKRRLLDCVAIGDIQSWNRWCADLQDGPVLAGLDLSHADLRGADFCCADLEGCNLNGANLSGANLSGARLDGTDMDGVRVNGADLFKTRLPRQYLGLLAACGIVEVESIDMV